MWMVFLFSLSLSLFPLKGWKVLSFIFMSDGKIMMLYNKRFLLGSMHLDGYLKWNLGKLIIFSPLAANERKIISIKIKFVIIFFSFRNSFLPI